MKIRFFIFLLLFISGYNYSYAETFTANSGRQNCAANTTINDTSGKKFIPSTLVDPASPAGIFTCVEHGYWSGSWSTWRNKTVSYSCPGNRYASQLECRNGLGVTMPCTGNGNGWTQYRVYCKFLDDTAPTLANVTVTPANNLYMLADSTKTVQVSVNVAGGSPTQSIKTEMERASNPAAFVSINQNNTNNFSYDFDLSRVDGTDRVTNRNYRPYSFNITEICDEAENCLSPVPISYTYNVYADGYNAGNSTVSFPNSITDGTSFADASNKTINLTLRDQYNNTIVPVRNASNALLRTVGFVFNHAAHSLRLNQYNSTSTAGAVEFQYLTTTITPNVGVTSSSFSETDASRNTGVYTLQTRVYAPTQNVYPKGDGNFSLSSLVLNITGMASTNLAINKVFAFKPIYETAFNGELVNNGFIEGATQSGTINITKNSNPASLSAGELYLEFGSGATNQPSLEYNLDFGKTTATNRAEEGNKGNISGLIHVLQTLGASQVINLKTLLTQSIGTSVGGTATSYLSSHIRYTLNGRLVQYNADVIGKNNYFGSTATGSTRQEGIKILGISSTDKDQELTSGQFSNDVRIIGKLVKSTFRKDISQNVYKLINNVTSVNTAINQQVGNLTSTSWVSTSNTGVRISENKALIYKDLGGKFVEILGGTITGVKTVVVTGGDVYITGNIINSAVQTSILGIIALKDENGLGGNIYIDPSVTDVHAVLYAEKTLMSAKDTNFNRQIDTSEVHNQSTPIATLANQLYIKGSLFSENTIGGSRSSPVECPYYVTPCVTSSVAQLYDLNFLRRYVRIDTDNNGTLDTIANSGNPSSGSTPSTQDYPVIIEYNSQLQINPPIFFN